MPVDSAQASMATDFTTVTELPGSRATREQQARLYHRYHTAARYATDKRILEAASGAGLGLGYLARVAKSVVGGDYTDHLLRIAQSHYQGRIPLLRFDAHHLPFCDQSYDLIVIFEAIYYLAQPERFVAESHRLLTKGGTLLIGTVNKDWSEFAPSPFSTRYFSVPELQNLLHEGGFTHQEFFGAFPITSATTKQKIISGIRRLVVALNLMPKTLEGRERFKRLFYGQLAALGPEVEDGMADLYPVVQIAGDVPNTQYKIIYAVGKLA